MRSDKGYARCIWTAQALVVQTQGDKCTALKWLYPERKQAMGSGNSQRHFGAVQKNKETRKEVIEGVLSPALLCILSKHRIPSPGFCLLPARRARGPATPRIIGLQIFSRQGSTSRGNGGHSRTLHSCHFAARYREVTALGRRRVPRVSGAAHLRAMKNS